MQTATVVNSRYSRWSQEFERVSNAQVRARRRLADPRLPEDQRKRLQAKVVNHQVVISNLHHKMNRAIVSV